MSRIIRWGMIGCGDVTERKSGPAFQKARSSSLVAVASRTPERAKDWAFRHGVGRWHADVQALIDDPEVDIVYVATPPSSHAELALRCAAAGKPAYVEKPMALDVSECEQMVRAFRGAGLPLFVAYYRRALPRFLRLRAILEDREIGAVRFAQIRYHRPVSEVDRRRTWRTNPSVSGGGLFVDLACHTIDVLGWMLGGVIEAGGMADNQAGVYAAEDAVAATLRFGGGALGSGIWCFSAAERADEVLLMGEAGSVRFATFGEDPIEVRSAGGERRETLSHPEHIQQPLIQSIVDELNGEGECPSTGETALATTRAMDSILRGWRARGKGGAG